GALVAVVEQLDRGDEPAPHQRPHLERLSFPVPRRGGLPALTRYASLLRDGRLVPAGYVEASRGCLHTCLHCPIPPVYGGRFFAVSAVASLSDVVLANLEKGHTRADVKSALGVLRQAGIALRPSFVPFTPWATSDDYLELLEWIGLEGLIDHVDPIQLAIRLLIPPGSLLVSRSAIRPFLGPLDVGAFTFRWTHPDPRMDALQR